MAHTDFHTEDRSVIDQPVYWFCLLEEAVGRGDLQAAAKAQRELARLGVCVAYGRLNAERQEVRRE
jgi:predicted short-subunit dehydrogenase-like oxidoreductase (DUF2520 family)